MSGDLSKVFDPNKVPEGVDGVRDWLEAVLGGDYWRECIALAQGGNGEEAVRRIEEELATFQDKIRAVVKHHLERVLMGTGIQQRPTGEMAAVGGTPDASDQLPNIAIYILEQLLESKKFVLLFRLLYMVKYSLTPEDKEAEIYALISGSSADIVILFNGLSTKGSGDQYALSRIIFSNLENRINEVTLKLMAGFTDYLLHNEGGREALQKTLDRINRTSGGQLNLGQLRLFLLQKVTILRKDQREKLDESSFILFLAEWENYLRENKEAVAEKLASSTSQGEPEITKEIRR